MMVRHGLGMYKLQIPGKQFISMIMLFRRILVTMQNYMDIENGEEYWFQLKKKGGNQRH